MRASNNVGHTFFVSLLTIVLAGSLINCGDDDVAVTQTLNLRIFNSDSTSGEGFPPAVLDQIWEVRVRVYQNGRERQELNRTFDYRDPSGRLPTLEFGENYQLVVEGLDQGLDQNQRVLADGATPIFDYFEAESIGEIQVFVSVVGGTDYASAVFVSGSSVVVAPSEFEGPFVAASLGLESEDLGGQRAGHTVTELPDGRILVVGGSRLTQNGGIGGTPFANFVDTIEVYDPFTSYWTMLRDRDAVELETNSGQFVSAPMRLSVARSFHTTTVIGNNQVLVAGGFADVDGRVDAVSAVEIIDIAAGTINILTRNASDLKEPRAMHSAHWLNDRLYVVGGITHGYNDPAYSASIEVFDPAGGYFEDALDASGTNVTLRVARGMHTGTTLADGILVSGGRGEGAVLDTIEFFEIADGELSAFYPSADVLAQMETPRFGHAAVLMQPSFDPDDGREGDVYLALAGGYTAVSESGTEFLYGGPITSSVEFFDTWDLTTATALTINMATPRAHFAIAETNIRRDLLMLGGITADGATVAIERWGRTTKGGFPLANIVHEPLDQPRSFASAVTLVTHNIMLVGGWDGGSDATACGTGALTVGCTSEIANPGELFDLGWLY